MRHLDDRTGGALRARLEERHREPHRRYHDLRHLHEVLRAVDELAEHVADLEAVRWAAWFHDAVYDVRRDDNEERSALLAQHELAAAGASPELVDEVARLVRLTASHRPSPGDANGAVLCDADLRILAAPPDRHGEYVRDVRAEYGHLSDEEFRAGRAVVLAGLSSAERLFHTPTAYAWWEDRARANLSAELRRLEHPA